MIARQGQRQTLIRWLSSSSSSSSSSGIKREYPWAESKKKDTTTQPPPNSLNLMSNVIQGPSLLLTSLDRPSPTMMLLPGLRSLPFWTETTDPAAATPTAPPPTTRVAYQDPTISRIVRILESQAQAIQDEYQRVVIGDGPNNNHPTQKNKNNGHDISLHEGDGRWDWHSYILQGKLQRDFAPQFPVTAAVLDELKDDLLTDTPFGFCFFSSLSSPSTIQPHASPVNFRLRVHLPLIVPTLTGSSSSNNSTTTTTTTTKKPALGIRVGPITKTWIPHAAMVLDDSYNHEAWNHLASATTTTTTNTTERVVLLVDVWHPDVRPKERTEIKRMFEHATQQGWISSSSS